MKWKCPKCGAGYRKHGKGMLCLSYPEKCEGLLCDCDEETGPGHGTTHADPCKNANCYHCGWGGRVPPLPKNLKPWEKRALAAGWTQPKEER